MVRPPAFTYRHFTSLLTTASALAILGGCGDDATGPDSNASLATGNATEAPSSLGGSAASETRINLAWQDNSKNESGFEVHRSTTGASGTFTLLARTASNATAYADQGLTASTEYCYEVRWFRNSGKDRLSAFTNVHCVRTLGRPPAPTSVTAVPSASYYNWIDITWAELSGTATSFRLERGPLPGGPWEKIADPPYWQRTYRDENRAVEVQACYQITAINGFGDSPSTVRCTTPPESPGNVTAAASGAQSIDVKWIDRSGAEDGFEIQRSIDGSSFIVAATVPANATTHRDAGLTTGTRYYYRVRATKDGGFSNYSITVTGLAIGAAPVSSPAINATANGSTGVVVYWTTTIANAEGYRAERSLNGGATWELAGTTNAFQTYIGDGDRTPEQSVCYRVFAFNGIGDAPASNVDCVTPPARVSDLTATPGGDGSIDLRWTDPSAVNTGYVVEYLETSYGYYYYYYPQQYWVQIATIGDVTSHRVSGLSWDLFHEFRVTALVAKGSGDPSNQVGSYTELPPQAPSNLTASVLSSSRIDLAWMDNSAGETYFTVERCEGTVATCANGFFWYVTLDADATGYSDNGVAPGKTYTYRIVAWKGAVPSVPSGTATVSVPAAQPE